MTNENKEIKNNDIMKMVKENYSIYNVYTFNDRKISSQSSWYMGLIKILTGSDNENNVINLYLSSGGGTFADADALIDLINQYKGTVNIHVSGYCYSAATMILLGCIGKYKRITITETTSFLFHVMRTPTSKDKITDNLSQIKFNNELQKYIFHKYYKGILTDEEIIDMHENGREIYLLGKDIIQRLKDAAYVVNDF